MLNPSSWLFLVQNVLLPIVISLGVLLADQYWHGRREYNRAFSRALSHGVDSKRNPSKQTIESLFFAAEAELEFAAEEVGKNWKAVKKDLENQIDWWIFNDEREEEVAERRDPEGTAV